MPRYDFKCRVCGTIVVDVFVEHPEFQGTYHCETQMEKLPAAPAFHVTGYNAKNGYSK